MSAGVKRSIRPLVVVPTQMGSHLSPTFFKLGAVWMQGIPSKLTGGSWCWSNMYIWVRSRIPKRVPSK